ncbi:MAG TPA: hypothetical protein VH583_17475 [Vicinamibacterales bacterium]
MSVMVLVSIVSTIVALAASFVAWRVVRDERRRSAARVAVLAEEIRAARRGSDRPSIDLPLRTESPRAQATEAAPALFAAPQPATAQFGLALAIGAFVVAAVAAAVALLSTGSPTASAADQNQQPPAVTETVAATTPLELVALGHERDGDTLSVQGVVRNPAGGAPLRALVAVVSAFDADGASLPAQQAIVSDGSLSPGSESPFTVTLSVSKGVSRYRVSFRSGGRVMPHVDKRSEH